MPVIGGTFMILSLFAATGASADVVFNMGYIFSGSEPPVAPAPWGKATFSDAGYNQVMLDMEAMNLSTTEFIRSWYFNLDPILDPSLLALTFLSGQASVGVGLEADGFRAGGDGFYDMKFGFSTSNTGNGRFTNLEHSIYRIDWLGAGTISESSFAFTSAPGGGEGSYQSALKLQGTGTSGEGSVWVGDDEPGDPTPVPEPTSLLLLGLAVAGAAAQGIIRRRR